MVYRSYNTRISHFQSYTVRSITYNPQTTATTFFPPAVVSAAAVHSSGPIFSPILWVRHLIILHRRFSVLRSRLAPARHHFAV